MGPVFHHLPFITGDTRRGEVIKILRFKGEPACFLLKATRWPEGYQVIPLRSTGFPDEPVFPVRNLYLKKNSLTRDAVFADAHTCDGEDLPGQE